MTAEGKKLRVGEALVAAGVLSEEQLATALEGQRSTGLRLGELLVAEGVISNAILVRTLAKYLNVPGCVLRPGLVDPAALELIGREEAERLKALPMFKVRDTLTIAMAEPQSLPTIDSLSRLTGCTIRPVLALEANIDEYIDRYSGTSGDVDLNVFLASLTESDVEVVERERIDEGPVTDVGQMIEGSPVINLVNLALMTAVRDGASDIHIEPTRNGTLIRYRIDGLLRELMNPPTGMHAAIVSRVKVVSSMDIAEKRLPQEGRIRIVAAGRGVDLRVSSMPTLLGEKLVVRILDKENLEIKMEELGFQTQALEAFQRVLKQPHGLALVTGPTGSGKTTTLYSALDLLRSPERNILTIEDPVEYQLDLINQIQVQEAIGMTFARALRSILRQDPDLIMVGEIRDGETAGVAVQAALTGHLVLATLHTNDAAGAVGRLLDMGVEAYLLTSALNGVVAQRLVRIVCQSCATKYYPSDEVTRDADLQDKGGRAFTKGAGCNECHNSGFRGRVGIYEVMEVTDSIRPMIHDAASSHLISAALRREGVPSLRESGVDLALRGKTSLEEALRATRVEGKSVQDEPMRVTEACDLPSTSEREAA